MRLLAPFSAPQRWLLLVSVALTACDGDGVDPFDPDALLDTDLSGDDPSEPSPGDSDASRAEDSGSTDTDDTSAPHTGLSHTDDTGDLDSDSDGDDTSAHTDTDDTDADDTSAHTDTDDTSADSDTDDTAPPRELVRYTCPRGGVRVPDDQPTIAAALTHLDAQPGGGTICLGSGVHTEWVDWSFTTQPITLQGAGAAHTTLRASQTFRMHANQDATVQGLKIDAAWNVSGHTRLTIQDVIARHGLRVRNNSSRQFEQVTIDRAEITHVATNEAALLIDPSSFSRVRANSFQVTVRNSWIHGGDRAVQVRNGTAFSGEIPDSIQVLFEHNTVVDSPVGMSFDAHHTGAGLHITLRGNLFARLGIGWRVVLGHQAASGMVRVGSHLNAYMGNDENHVGTTAHATPAANDLFEDCHLDAHQPPAPAPGSPCQDALGTGPALDLFQNSRNSTPDIGAVEIVPR